MNQPKVPLSVVVPVKNEAGSLARCLQSVSWAAEIFVVDSHSSDRTAEIAESFGARVYQFDFSGKWPKKKNWALENLPFSFEWVFILDADEVLPPEAEAEIGAIVSAAPGIAGGDGAQSTSARGDGSVPGSSSQGLAGYWINRRFMFMGKWLRHAYYPNWNLRLFKHKLGRYEKLTDSDTQSGDNEVHEHVLVDGQTGRLRVEMDHYSYPSIAEFVEKHNRYSNWEAHVALEAQSGNVSGKLQMPSVGLRRKLRILSLRAPLRPLLRFAYIYFWQKGFLDGMEGYYFARLHAVYEFLIIAKTHELRLRARKTLSERD